MGTCWLQALVHDHVEPMLLDAVQFAQLPPSQMRYTHVLLKVRLSVLSALDIDWSSMATQKVRMLRACVAVC